MPHLLLFRLSHRNAGRRARDGQLYLRPSGFDSLGLARRVCVGALSPAHLSPQKFGIRRIKQQPERDLAIYFDYEVEAGLSADEAATVVERLLDVLPTKRLGQYYVHDV